MCAFKPRFLSSACFGCGSAWRSTAVEVAPEAARGRKLGNGPGTGFWHEDHDIRIDPQRCLQAPGRRGDPHTRARGHAPAWALFLRSETLCREPWTSRLMCLGAASRRSRPGLLSALRTAASLVPTSAAILRKIRSWLS